ncbi:MAG: hypothetical protein ACLSHO_12740 [Dysosmobacter sp.]
MNGCWRSCRRRRRSLSAKRWTRIYRRSKQESRAGLPTSRLLTEQGRERHE